MGGSILGAGAGSRLELPGSEAHDSAQGAVVGDAHVVESLDLRAARSDAAPSHQRLAAADGDGVGRAVSPHAPHVAPPTLPQRPTHDRREGS